METRSGRSGFFPSEVQRFLLGGPLTHALTPRAQGACSYGPYKYGLLSYSPYTHGLYSYGLIVILPKSPRPNSYDLYSYGLCSYGLHSDGIYSYGLYRYGPYRYGPYRYGPYSYGLCSHMASQFRDVSRADSLSWLFSSTHIVMASTVMAHIVMAYRYVCIGLYIGGV